MGSSISKNTDKENKKLEKDQQKVPNVTKPAKQNHQQEQQDLTILGNEPKPSVVVTNKYLHEKKSNLQSLQKKPQQDRARSITTPKPSVIFTTKHISQQTSSLKTKQIKKEVIAAIEIGYTHSGYVFCLGKKYALEGEGLYCPNWEARDNGVVSFKTSTAILFRPDKSIHSIGYEAEEYVSRNQNESDSAKWFFFKNFMVEFYKLKDTAIEDLKMKDFWQNNVTMNAVDVISSFINQMKDKLMNELAKQQLRYNDNDIQWVLTTPGTLEPSKLQLMNTAATKAGITHDQLTLLQGPQAELMYNRTFTSSPSTFGEEQIAPLTKFYRSLLVHLGGVAFNLTVVEVNEKKTNILETIFNTNESAKQEFIRFLTRLFGGDVLKYLRDYHPLEYFELLHNFEKKLKYFESDKVVTVRVPPKWYDAFKEFTSDTLTNSINQTRFRDAVSFQNDKIRISSELFHKFYENATEFTIEMVEKTLAKQSALGIGILFIAGDHVDHVFVNTLKERYPAHRIIISKNPELVVLKGAVLCEILE